MSTSTRKPKANGHAETATSPVVDMRNRPRFLHPFFGANDSGPEHDLVTWVNGRVGSRDPKHFERATDADAFAAEVRDAGITIGVVVGRDTPSVSIPNDAVAALVAAHPQRLIGIGAVDPQRLGIAAALEEVDRAVRDLGLRGINLDPGFFSTPLRADDAALIPIYQRCVELGVAAFVMSGPTTPDFDFNHPNQIGRVAAAFPTLPIVCCHGYYPFVDEMVGVAFKCPNVYVSPDMYLFAPGAKLYVEAANGFMREQLLFGTSFPFRPMRQSVDDAATLGLDDASFSNVMWRNADRLLKLGIAESAPR